MNEHRVVHDYGLCAMVKTAQDGDFNVHTNLVSKLVACHQHQGELVQCHLMCLQDHSLYRNDLKNFGGASSIYYI